MKHLIYNNNSSPLRRFHLSVKPQVLCGIVKVFELKLVNLQNSEVMFDKLKFKYTPCLLVAATHL